jgi:DivIVA domain-containing protein
MPEDPQVVTISSNTSLSPDEILRKTFPPARRGVDADAVRSFLADIAATMRDHGEREAQLRRFLSDAERRAANPEIDEAILSRAIGSETAKILQSAHEAARDLLDKAETRAAELTSEAEQLLAEHSERAATEAAEVREAAELEASTVTQEAVSSAQALADEARAEAEAITEFTRQEADALTEAAHADAVALLEATKDECRQMVAEARDLRNRVLADLAERRRGLHVQLEELRTGKDSLIEVVETVGLTVDDLRERLAGAEDEARLAATEAGQRAALEPDDEDLGAVESELAATTAAVLAESAAVEALAATVEQGKPSSGADLEAELAAAAERVAEDSDGDGDTGAAPTTAPGSRRSVDELFARIRASRAAEQAADAAEAEIEAEEHEEDERLEEGLEVAEIVKAVDELVEVLEVINEAVTDAEIEAEEDEEDERLVEGLEVVVVLDAIEEVVELHEEAVAQAPEATEASSERAYDLGEELTEPDVEALARRDQLLNPVAAKLGRALKRALQDDQNELLDALRHVSGSPDLDEVLPANAQRERFVTATEEHLAAAYAAGAVYLVEGDATEGPSVVAPAPSRQAALDAARLVAAQLADDLTTLLRKRIERSLAEIGSSGEGAADGASAAYREWKGSRVEGLGGDFATRAFAVGGLEVLASVAESDRPLVRWVVEDEGSSGTCPDCDDNSLAGALAPGEEFPTGQVQPPVHPGCRCLLVPVRS